MTNLAEAIQNACEIARQDERKQFKEYLEERKHDFGIDYIVNPIELLDEIINELFGETKTNTDREE